MSTRTARGASELLVGVRVEPQTPLTLNPKPEPRINSSKPLKFIKLFFKSELSVLYCFVSQSFLISYPVSISMMIDVTIPVSVSYYYFEFSALVNNSSV